MDYWASEDLEAWFCNLKTDPWFSVIIKSGTKQEDWIYSSVNNSFLTSVQIWFVV